jgi:hypothetical protein
MLRRRSSVPHDQQAVEVMHGPEINQPSELFRIHALFFRGGCLPFLRWPDWFCGALSRWSPAANAIWGPIRPGQPPGNAVCRSAELFEPYLTYRVTPFLRSRVGPVSVELHGWQRSQTPV